MVWLILCVNISRLLLYANMLIKWNFIKTLIVEMIMKVYMLIKLISTSIPGVGVV